MRIYLVRHAEAEDARPDASRPLTEKGREQARWVGKFFKRIEPRLRVFSSPLARARETAEAIGEPETLEILAEGPPVDAFIACAKKLDPAGAYAFVGHQPGLGALAGALSGRPPIDLKKGAVVLIAFEGPARPGAGELSLLVAPKTLRELL